jgi:TolA-binding protein
MKSNPASWTRRFALVLIIGALAGTAVSFHLTLESRFAGLEEKSAQQTAALQAMQESLDTIESSKNETLSGLNKQLTSLQSSFEPLGKTSQAQADALNRVRQQLAGLQKAQDDQQDAQKKFSAYLTQLETAVKKARADAAAAATFRTPTPTVIPPPATKTAVSLPVSVPLPVATNAPSDLMASPGAISHPADHAMSESIQAEMLPQPAAPRALPVGAGIGR